jgi:hypothetical protein
LRAVFGCGGFGLTQRVLVRTGIDLKQQIAFLNIPAFGEMHRRQLAGNLRFDLNGGGRLNATDGVNLFGNRFFSGHRDRDRHGRRRSRGFHFPRAASAE